MRHNDHNHVDPGLIALFQDLIIIVNGNEIAGLPLDISNASFRLRRHKGAIKAVLIRPVRLHTENALRKVSVVAKGVDQEDYNWNPHFHSLK